jgi:hypothetical protein
VSADDLILAAENYARDCRARGAELQYIKHPATFLGPSKPYEEWIKPVQDRQTSKDDCRKSKDKPQNPPDPPKPSYLRPFEVNEAESKAWDEKWQRENLQRRQA